MITRRTPEELKAALDNQRAALTDSCKAFDEGKKWEALRIAVAIYTIVHDGGKRNKSILTQLGLKDTIQFLASGIFIDGKNLLRDAPMVAMQIRGEGTVDNPLPPTAEYIAHCTAGYPSTDRMMPFLQWWERDLIFRDRSFSLTRKKLTFNLRSVEGGAHYDAMVEDPNYLRFSTEQPTTPQVGIGESSRALLGAELATMRQIGWELLQSLDRMMPF